MWRLYCSRAVKWTLACNAGKTCRLPSARCWGSGSLTIKPRGGNEQTCIGSQREARCLWHPRWLWLSRPAFPISPHRCTCQETCRGRRSRCTWCLLWVQQETHGSSALRSAHCRTCRACKVQRCAYTLSVYLMASPRANVGWMKSMTKEKMKKHEP